MEINATLTIKESKYFDDKPLNIPVKFIVNYKISLQKNEDIIGQKNNVGIIIGVVSGVCVAIVVIALVWKHKFSKKGLFYNIDFLY